MHGDRVDVAVEVEGVERLVVSRLEVEHGRLVGLVVARAQDLDRVPEAAAVERGHVRGGLRRGVRRRRVGRRFRLLEHTALGAVQAVVRRRRQRRADPSNDRGGAVANDVTLDVVARVPARRRRVERQLQEEDAVALVGREVELAAARVGDVGEGGAERRVGAVRRVVRRVVRPVHRRRQDRVGLGRARRRREAHDEHLVARREADEVGSVRHLIVDVDGAVLGQRREVEDRVLVEARRNCEGRRVVEFWGRGLHVVDVVDRAAVVAARVFGVVVAVADDAAHVRRVLQRLVEAGAALRVEAAEEAAHGRERVVGPVGVLVKRGRVDVVVEVVQREDERVVARVDVELAHVVGLGVVAPFQDLERVRGRLAVEGRHAVVGPARRGAAAAVVVALVRRRRRREQHQRRQEARGAAPAVRPRSEHRACVEKSRGMVYVQQQQAGLVIEGVRLQVAVQCSFQL